MAERPILSDDQIDLAIGAMPSLREFLHQDMHVRLDLRESLDDLLTLFPQDNLPTGAAAG